MTQTMCIALRAGGKSLHRVRPLGCHSPLRPKRGGSNSPAIAVGAAAFVVSKMPYYAMFRGLREG